MNKINLLIPLFLSLSLNFTAFSQDIDQALDRYLKKDITMVSIEELNAKKSNYLLLDAREQEEYEVSKIENSIWIGYENFSIEALENIVIERYDKIVVYCSIGVRSEIIARQIKEQLQVEIYNLYGGIFLWKNEGFPVVDKNQNYTNRVHGYSKKWGKYLSNAEVVYEK